MKKGTPWLTGACLLSLLMVAAIVAALRPPAQAEDLPSALRSPHSGELLQNPGFEAATDGIPDHWKEYGAVELRQVSTPCHGGSHAAVLTNTLSSTRWAYQMVQVVPAQRYEFSAWAIKDDEQIDAIYVQVRWYASTDGSGPAIATDDSNHLTDDGAEYRYLTTGIVTAPAAARSAQLHLRIDPGSAPVAAYFDDASFAPEPAADLSVAKTGPATTAPGRLVTYTLTLENVGALAAPGVRLTDTLPAALSFVTQCSPFTFTLPQPDGPLAWEIGEVPSSTGHTITLTAQVTGSTCGPLTNRITATTTTTEPLTANNSAAWTTTILPPVHLYALEPVNYGKGGEAAAIINLSPHTVALEDWRLNDDPGAGGVSFPTGATIEPEQTLWLAQDADGFYPIWGFDADWATQAVTRPVPGLLGSWPGFTDGGESAYLLAPGGHVADALIYGDDETAPGWSGPTVPYPYAGYGAGQVLYRKPDQITGLPIPDTDTAADWAQAPDDPIGGRKLRYPGWDLEELLSPAEITATASFTLAVAPEGALELVSQTIAGAEQTLLIEAYTLESLSLHRVISDRIRAGVTVTVLLESDPAGGLDDVERWIVQRLHDPPSSTIHFLGGTPSRYRYQHAKFILVDGRRALVSSDNFGQNSMPSDPKQNGTMGHRGFVAVTDSPGVVAYLGEIFRRDCDPLHHRDVSPYDDTYAPPADFVPLPSPDWTTYTAPFTAPLVTTATHVTVLHAPEHTLRDRDGLLGLLNRAGSGDRIAAMQMSEPFTWTAGAGPAGLNPRLQALIGAARQGAAVRVLLDSYYDDPLAANGNAAACLRLNGLAGSEALSLTCRLGNTTGLGIHAKAFIASVGGERWVHLGSINGTENSNKNNREVALQLRSGEAVRWMETIFEHDWGMSHAPMIHRIQLPLILHGYVGPANYPLITEVFINPTGEESRNEWVELFNPGPTASIGGWTLGDALEVEDYGDGRYAFPSGEQLLHGQVIVAAACATDFSAAHGFNPAYEWTDCDPAVPDLEPVAAWEGFGLALGNASDELLLLDVGAALADSVAWGGTDRAGVVPFTDFIAPFPWDASLKRHPPDTDRDDCSGDFYVSYTPSPGYVAGYLLNR